MSNSYCLAVIPARGGSTRLPMNNIKPLGGRPLIAWCVGAALKCRDLDRVIVSTDHEQIAEAARAAGAETPFTRPRDISGNIPSEIVVQHATQFHEEETGIQADIIVTIQPTSPFVSASDIDACLVALDNDASLSSAVSVSAVHERPEWMFSREKGSGILGPLLDQTIRGSYGVSQELPVLYHPNGAVYATRRNTLFDQKSLYGERCFGHIMDRLHSIDIDEDIDLLTAEGIFQHMQENMQ